MEATPLYGLQCQVQHQRAGCEGEKEMTIREIGKPSDNPRRFRIRARNGESLYSSIRHVADIGSDHPTLEGYRLDALLTEGEWYDWWTRVRYYLRRFLGFNRTWIVEAYYSAERLDSERNDPQKMEVAGTRTRLSSSLNEPG